MNDVTFTKVALPNGWLSNMSPHPVDCFGVTWRTTEALFQALRFSDPEIREHIRSQKSPMGAKLAAKSRKSEMTVEELGSQDVRNMAFCVRLKAKQHESVLNDLFATGESLIVEDVTSRAGRGSSMFWGAQHTNLGWRGENRLGKLWMQLRADLRAENILVPMIEELKSEGYQMYEHSIVGAVVERYFHIDVDYEFHKIFNINDGVEPIKTWIKSLLLEVPQQ